MKKLTFIFVELSCFMCWLFAGHAELMQAQPIEETIPVQSLFERLDDAISKKKDFQARRAAQADSLQRLALRTRGEERIQAVSQRYNVYLHYQTDSE